MTPTPGDIIAGKYRVERVLGVGGMGVVVSVVHIDLLERRAIKLMRPESVESPQAVERFLREARAAARLKSEHVAKVHDTGRLESGEPFMVMEYLEGSDLNALVKSRRSLPIEEAAHYVLQACEALAEAHTAGIVHRDLKPANLFLTQDAAGAPIVKVLDFGISKASGTGGEGALGITRSDALLGSPLFMSPEQMRSPRDADLRSDIWSIGAILYKLITGRAPFVADSILALFLIVMDKPASPPSTLKPAIPPELDAVILRCLSKDPAERYASVGELSVALAPFAPPEALSLVDRIARVLSATPSSPAQASTAGGTESFAPPQTLLEGRGISKLPPAAPRSSVFDAIGEASTREQAKTSGLREDAPETSPGTWGHTRGGPLTPAPRRRRPRAMIPALSAAGGAIVAVLVVILVMWSGSSKGTPETAESAITPVAVLAGRALAPALSASIAVEPATAPAAGTGSAPATVPAPVTATVTVPAPLTAPVTVPATGMTDPRGAPSGAAPFPRGALSAAPSVKKPDIRSRNTF